MIQIGCQDLNIDLEQFTDRWKIVPDSKGLGLTTDNTSLTRSRWQSRSAKVLEFIL